VDFQLVHEVPTEGFYFHFLPESCELQLHRAGLKDKGLVIDFKKEFAHFKREKLSVKRDLLGRALSVTVNKKICDLTMGLAQDGFKLAYLGAHVTGVERNPFVAALVKNALERATALECLKHFEVHFGQLQDFVKTSYEHFDAFYLDPMFSHKRTALPKKDMQYLADLVDEAEDESYRECMEFLIKKRKQLVVKRPRQAGPLCGMEPKRVLEGKMIRFDVYS
jgi:16S rRNA (guanine1516-N2)-methyltransferase